MQTERGPSSRWVGVALGTVLLLMLCAQWFLVGGAPADPQAARAHIESLQQALDRYRADRGGYPTTAQGLSELRTPYLPAGIPDDPWGRPYQYLSPGRGSPNGYDLYTLGRDGRPGGEGEDADLFAAPR